MRAGSQRGFTMIEAIVVIVLIGIIGTIIAVFVLLPVRSYTDSVARAEATDLADTTMRRLTRDLRTALPNSVRVNGAGTYIEFIETKAGLRYLAEEDVTTPVLDKFLNWNDSSMVEFRMIGALPTGNMAPVANVDSMVVYNLGPGQEPGNAYDCSVACNRALITALDPTIATAPILTLDSNPFALQTAADVALMSPGKRFHLITWSVSYGCDTATKRLTRYWNYGISSSQATPPTGGSSAILAENVNDCSFSYTDLANQRSGLVGISLSFNVADQTGASVTLAHQVHVDNSP